MKDGTELKGVYVFEDCIMEENMVRGKSEIAKLLNSDDDTKRNVFVRGECILGVITPQRIQEYRIVDEDEEMIARLLPFIQENSHFYDINYLDVAGFIQENQDGLMRILKYD